MSYDLKINKESLCGEIFISDTPTKVKIGTDQLERRHQISVRNLSSYYIWWSFNEADCIYGGSNAQLIRSGEGFNMRLDKDHPIDIWCIAKVSRAPLEVLEVK